MPKNAFTRILLGLALFAFAMLAAHRALAAPAIVTFNVNNTLDVADDNPGDGFCHTAAISPAAGACTLRAAVMEADMASGVGVTIIVPAGVYSLTVPATVGDDASNGDLNLTTPASGNPVISIVGAGAANTIIDANQIDRVLRVDAGRTAVISGLTLRGGFASEVNGGGIENLGTLTVDHSSISGNQATAPGEGGGISNEGQLTVADSTIGPDNSAHGGGGLVNLNTLTLERSTVYGNSAQTGAGIVNGGGTNLTVINSTLSQNTAGTTGGNGGAIENHGTANVYNSTIIFNSADTDPNTSTAAGGVWSASSGSFNMRNTLVAGNYHDNSFEAADCTGTVNSYGRNLFGTLTPCTVVTGSGSWTAVNSLNLIGPLQNNGGPTWTHALLAGSNAIDGGDPVDGCVDNNSVPLDTDQRGIPRVVGASCDIGAFEYLPQVLYLPLVRR